MIKANFTRPIVLLAGLVFMTGFWAAGSLETFGPEAAARAELTRTLAPVQAEQLANTAAVGLENTRFLTFWVNRILIGGFAGSVGMMLFLFTVIVVRIAVNVWAQADRKFRDRSTPAVRRVGDLVFVGQDWIFDTITGRYFRSDSEMPAELARAQVAQVRYFMRGMAEIAAEARSGNGHARDLVDWVLPVLTQLPHPGQVSGDMVFQAENLNQNRKTV